MDRETKVALWILAALVVAIIVVSVIMYKPVGE